MDRRNGKAGKPDEIGGLAANTTSTTTTPASADRRHGEGLAANLTCDCTYSDVAFTDVCITFDTDQCR